MVLFHSGDMASISGVPFKVVLPDLERSPPVFLTVKETEARSTTCSSTLAIGI